MYLLAIKPSINDVVALELSNRQYSAMRQGVPINLFRKAALSSVIFGSRCFRMSSHVLAETPLRLDDTELEEDVWSSSPRTTQSCGANTNGPYSGLLLN